MGISLTGGQMAAVDKQGRKWTSVGGNHRRKLRVGYRYTAAYLITDKRFGFAQVTITCVDTGKAESTETGYLESEAIEAVESFNERFENGERVWN